MPTAREVLGSLHELGENPVALYLLSLGSSSRATMRSGLRQAARRGFGWPEEPESFPWWELRASQTSGLRSWLRDTYAPSTANRIICAVRSVLWQCHRLELLSDRDHRVLADIAYVDGFRLPAGRALALAEIRTLLDACDLTSPLQARNAALVAVLYGAGLRRSEAVGLDMDDVDVERGRLRIRRAKGNRDRFAYVAHHALDWLERWLEHRGREPGPVFWSTRVVGGRRLGVRELIGGSRLSGDGVGHILEAIAKRTGIDFTSHDLRRTFISELLDAGADIAVVARQVGHTDVQTTAKYDRRGERAQAEAARRLKLPAPCRRRRPSSTRAWAA